MAEQANSNGYDRDVLANIVGRIERCYNDLASLKGIYMADCRVVRERMVGIYDEAKERGIPKKELKSLIKDRDLVAKRIKLLEDMEQDERAAFEKLRDDLGDFGNLPLGAAALERVRPKGEEQLDSLAEAGRKDEAQLESLGRGPTQ